MNTEFFERKRPWSKYKDSILRDYLTSYIPKVASLGKPILIVDCFAGCGEFGDGEPGSPLIICEAIKPWHEQGTQVSGDFIEFDPDNFRVLERVLSPYSAYATCTPGRFEDSVDRLASRAKHESIFLYVDPYTVKGLDFARMKSVYDRIRDSKASVELLLNFNVATFMRWALAALMRNEPIPMDAMEEDADYLADNPNERVEIATLNGIAGGDYWRSIAASRTLAFAEKLTNFTDQFVKRLHGCFDHVCAYPVKSKYEHLIPKYMLIFATRSPVGFELMNEVMCTVRRQFLGSQFKAGFLFDTTPDVELPDLTELKETLVEIVVRAGQTNRKKLRQEAVMALFCRYLKKDINLATTELLKSKRLFSSTGKARVNDRTLLSTRPFD